jgi:hypothetical protein
MSCYEFAWVVDGFDVEDDATLDRLYETFDDVAAGSVAGRVTVDFVIEAEGPAEALFTTLDRFREAFPRASVLRLDRDLVAIPDIADRTDRTPESVRLLVNGKRGSGGFPAPVGTLGGGTRVWEWAAVVEWFAETGQPVEENTLIDHELACYFESKLACDAGAFSPVHEVLAAPPTRARRARVEVTASALVQRYEVSDAAIREHVVGDAPVAVG